MNQINIECNKVFFNINKNDLVGVKTNQFKLFVIGVALSNGTTTFFNHTATVQLIIIHLTCP